MKNLIILFVLAGMLIGLLPSQAHARGQMFVEIGALARSQGFSTTLRAYDLTCYAPKAVRSYGSQVISYEFGVFNLGTQLGNRGILMVSRDTKCHVGAWNQKLYPATKWQWYNYFNHHPTLYQGDTWNSVVRNNATRHLTPWCRANRLEVVSKVWGNEIFDNVGFRNVVLFIPTDAWDGLTSQYFPKYAYTLWYISKDVKCFGTQQEAEKGGYRLLITAR